MTIDPALHNTAAGDELDPKQSLRQQAEKNARDMGIDDLEPLLPKDVRRLLYELRVHQIELEMQNDELQRVQEALETSRASYIDLYELAPVGYLTLSESGIIQQANLTTATLLGVSRKAIIKQPLSRFIIYEDQDIFYHYRRRLFETGALQVCELRLLRADSASFWARLEGNKVQDVENGDRYCRVALIDIAAGKQAEEEIRSLNIELEQRVEARTYELRTAQEKLIRQEGLAVLGRLADSVGHELRNPLCVINNATYFLKLAQPDANEQVKEYLDLIENETRTADKIICDLLDYSRIKSVDRELVAVADLVRRVIERVPAPQGVSVIINISDDLPPIYADLNQMMRVLENLMVNAYQSMPDGGELTLSAAQDGKELAIAVVDTGVGIAPENMARLFEPLFTTKAKGIGLGLTICKELTELNRGRIEVQSKPGRGSVFRLCFPLKA